jgi:hypothetical protein
MAIGITIAVLVALSVIIYLIFEFKRFQHKIFAIVLIALILFLYFSFIYVFRSTDIDFTSAKGVSEASKIYFSWLLSIFTNFKEVTANAIKMDWGFSDTNSTR